MTARELRDKLASLPPDTKIAVWDLGEGGLVYANEVDYVPNENYLVIMYVRGVGNA